MKLIINLLLFFSFSLFSQDFNRKEWMVWKSYKGCLSVREKVLIDNSLKPIKMKSTNCEIISGEWKPIWENKTYINPKEVDVDHTVPLSWAWKHGANKWDKQTKINYANNFKDTYHLLPLSIKANRTKSDKGPDEWLPETNRCMYINIFMDIVNKNKLQLSEDEMTEYLRLRKKECQK